MRVTISSGDKQVQIAVKGSGPKKLRRVEKSARRILAQMPASEPAKPFGFALGSDTQLSYQDE